MGVEKWVFNSASAQKWGGPDQRVAGSGPGAVGRSKLHRVLPRWWVEADSGGALRQITETTVACFPGSDNCACLCEWAPNALERTLSQVVLVYSVPT